MATKITNLEDALAVHLPRLEAQCAAQMRRYYDTLVKVYGTKNISRAGNSFDHYHMWAFCRPAVERITEHFRHVDNFLNEALVEAVAKRYAKDAVEMWREKLEAKLEGATDAVCVDYHSAHVVILAKLKDAPVRVEQQCILNVSSKGKVFNQFPALLYVNGKKTSEAAYKKLASACEGIE